MLPLLRPVNSATVVAVAGRSLSIAASTTRSRPTCPLGYCGTPCLFTGNSKAAFSFGTDKQNYKGRRQPRLMVSRPSALQRLRDTRPHHRLAQQIQQEADSGQQYQKAQIECRAGCIGVRVRRSEEHTSELQSQPNL